MLADFGEASSSSSLATYCLKQFNGRINLLNDRHTQQMLSPDET
jgi:hypothetical protein